MIYGGAGYKVLLALHLLAVVVAFGPWFLNGLFPMAAAKRAGDHGRAINAVNYQVSKYTQFAIYAVLIFGGALIGASNKAVKFSQTWVWLSLLLWFVIVGVLHGLILPAQKALGDETGDTAALTQRQSLGAAIINILVIVVIFLMVFEPGHALP